jgi:UDP-N-acetylmuramoyl-tripeptide--D-alanyl-D-alanine ligase
MIIALLVPNERAPFIASAIVFAAAPLFLIAANGCLMPYERAVQAGYEAEAVDRVKSTRPFIIGITGSYGKSSAKAMLAHILQFKGPTLAASGSINTLMGVTRHLREELVHGHQFMVVEMGAFARGSISRLCQLTPPSAGLITAVGDMHLERFGSLDEIVRAKSELAQAVPPGGLIVVNADSPGALRIAKSARDRCVLLYGETSTEDLDTRLEQVNFSRAGSTFVLRTRDRAWSCATPLVGRPILLNLTGAFTLASAIGVDPAIIVSAMRTLKPVSNRLEVVEERGVTWIRDAYNSNQFGFRAALEVAAAMPAKRRFLATPGVIELGSDQFEVNRALSKEAAERCDRTLVVAATNREAFVAGHRDAGREDRLVPVAGRAEAFRWLNENLQDQDVVILENDLPDLYDRPTGLFF